MKPPIYHHDIQQGTPEWLALRSGKITASTFSKLVTTKNREPANNETSRKLLRTILAERLTGLVEDSYQSDDMLRGSMDEDFIRQLYVEDRGKPVQLCGFVTRQNRDATIGYSPDGLIGNTGLIEIKRPRQDNQIQRILENKIPDEYFWQIHVGLAVTGRAWCDFVSYAPGLPMMILRVRPDPELRSAIWTAAIAAENSIKEMEEQLWTLAKKHKYPPTKLVTTILMSDIII